MKLISWNINGIRSVIKKGFLDFIKEHNPDIICLQEVKAEQHQAKLELADYQIYWHAAYKKGYSGTAILTKHTPHTVMRTMNIGGISQSPSDEGRVLTAELDEYYLVNVYTPNSQRGLHRLSCRIKWDEDFLNYLRLLEQRKPVIFCGDLNVAHTEIDLANPKLNRQNPGFTDEERKGFSAFINNGFIDTFRHFNKRPHHYTWWSYMRNARKNNIGWRIDYFCISNQLLPNLKNAFILADVLGSDHCPIGIIID